MKRKLLAILTSVLMLCAMLPLGAMGVSAATSGITGNCTWTLDGTHLTISGNGKMGDYSSNLPPWGTSVTSVTIEDGVTTVSAYAFYACRSLTSATIGNSVTTIERCAFHACESLTSITIPNSVTTIDDRAFDWCESLSSVNIGTGVTYIGEEAFAYCYKLTSIAIPDSVTYIGDAAFKRCTSLTSIQVDENNSFYCADSALFNKEKTTLIMYPAGATASSYAIPNSVTTIGDSAFYYCTKLTTIIIPDSVTTIGDYAFYYCSALTSVTIPNNVASINAYTFLGCTSLSSINLSRNVASIGFRAFYNCSMLTDIYYNGNEADYESITTSSGNDPLLNATWRYAADPISTTVTHSVMDTANGNGLAFRFELSANSVAVKNRTEVDFSNAMVNYLGKDCKLIGMGAVLTNDANLGNNHLIIDQSNGQKVIDIPVVYVQDVTDTSCAFATRLINIPDTALERTIYARPYYIIEVDGEEIVVYGDVDTASCAEYM